MKAKASTGSKKAALEAVLFCAPDPVPVEELAVILAISEAQVQSLLLQLEEEYAHEERGFFLERVGGGVRLCSKPQYASFVEALGRTTRSGALSQAALETLAIIAYRQPITRPEIEAIRGVRAESAIASLIERGLVEEKGRSDGPGRPILYGTTQEFLVRFGLRSLADLPPLNSSPQDEDPQPKLEFAGE
ncbi:MAG: SMC-Scp complex subunit ScpB [Clostridia bacterium]|nr:SMC-Scp complex subunit ScpB [Bacillota bacterium]